METLALEFKTNYPKNLYINLNNFNGKCHTSCSHYLVVTPINILGVLHKSNFFFLQ